MRKHRLGPAVSLALTLALTSALSAALLALPPVPLGGATVSPARASASPETPTVVSITASHRRGHDRVVFRFDGGLPEHVSARYVDRLVGDGSGLPVRIAGQAVLRVRFSDAQAHDDSGETVAARTAYALPNVMTTVRAGDFEAVTTYGVGLARRTRFRVSSRENPSRVVLNVRAAFRTVDREVYFFDRDAYLANDESFFVATKRPVLPGSPATGVMDRLFAGPVPREHANGLRLLRSHATSYDDLGISDRIARVRLTGGCSSDGSTVTVAGEIMPTLRQFASVDWVKVLAPDGTTGSPTGNTDSIPACLEP